jgi:hypothetical protein
VPGRAIIYGTTHQLQQIARPQPSAVLSATRECYRFDLIRIIENQNINSILEEANANYPSIARAIAEERGLAYSCINMPLEEREAAGWVPDPFEDALNPETPSNQVRERYMAARICERNEDRVLVVCGQLHVAGIRDLIRAHDVEVLTDSSFNRAWYAPFLGDHPILIAVETSPELEPPRL